MRELWQADIFNYMIKKLNMTQQSICYSLKNHFDIPVDTPKMNRLVKEKAKTGYDGIDPKDFYEKIIEPERKNAHIDSSQALSELKAFLHNGEEEITFSGQENLANSDYEDYMRAVVRAGISKVKDPNAIRKKKKTNHLGPVQTFSETSTAPTLHSQKIDSIASFTGREDILNKMADLLQTKSTVVLFGLGGIGKTSLANAYAARHGSHYAQRQHIVWSDTKTKPSFRQMILSLAFDGLDESEMEEENKFQQRMRLLKKMDSSVLLILDNIDELPDDFAVYYDLRTNSGIHIIITTRSNEILNETDEVIEVEELEDEKQVELFERYYKDKVKAEDRAALDEILKCIEGHTLLIELIAKTMHAGSLDYSQMLELLQKDTGSEEMPVILIQKDNDHRHDKMLHYVRKVLFDVSHLSKEQQNSMRYLVLLPIEGISRKLFLQKLSPQSAGALVYLETRSQVIRDRDIIRLHPVIRDVIKAELPPTCDACRIFLNDLQQLLTAADTADFSEDLCKLIRSTIKTLARDLDENPCAENMSFLIDSANFYRSHKEYDYSGALEIYDAASKILKSGVPSLCEGSATVKLYLAAGQCYQSLPKYAEAICCYEAAENAAEKGSHQLAEVYLALGEVYRKKNDYDKALHHDELALKIFTEKEETYYIAKTKNAMGVVYLNRGDEKANRSGSDARGFYLKAKEYYSEARALWETYREALKPNDPKSGDLTKRLAFVNHNIGTAYHNLGQFHDAKKQHLKGLEYRRKGNFPEYRRDMASSHVWIAKDYLKLREEALKQGDSSQAEAYLKKADEHIQESLSIRKELLGARHPEYAWTLDTLSDWYKAKGEIGKALSTMEMVVDIRQEKLPADHRYTKQAIEKRDDLAAAAKSHGQP